ncbi:MAG TPA: GlsB/YeaQ/YmgE family stress response membrane protein [Marmoricola sp.]|nr:GlsB/YeaQ/YmgE family stress response membrane protein [Marmoricola sp.]
MVSTVLWILIGGTVIGLLGKFVAPGGRDNIPLWLTIICGIGGMLIGTYLYTAVGGSADTKGIDWLRHGVQVIVAAVLVGIAAMVTGRRA